MSATWRSPLTAAVLRSVDNEAGAAQAPIALPIPQSDQNIHNRIGDFLVPLLDDVMLGRIGGGGAILGCAISKSSGIPELFALIGNKGPRGVRSGMTDSC
jgi:hypothetical protein